MNLVLAHNIDRIYALTYDNGQLSFFDVFINQYYEHLSQHLKEDYMNYFLNIII